MVMEIIINFLPSCALIHIVLLLLFNMGNRTGEGTFLMTVNQNNIIEGHIAFDMTEGKEKIRLNFTQKYFYGGEKMEEESEEWLLLFEKHKTFSIDNVTKTFRESDNSESFDKIIKENFNLDREEKSIFYSSEIAPGKTASFSKINETSAGYLMRIKDKNVKNLITSMEIRDDDVFIHVDFFLSSDKVTSEIFNIPEGYKKVK